MTTFRIVKDRVMLTARHDHGRHQNVGLATRLCLQECDDGKLAQIKLLLPYQGFERLVGCFDVRENKVYEERSHFPASPGAGAGVRSQQSLRRHRGLTSRHRFPTS